MLRSGSWHLCQAAVETVLHGGGIRPLPELDGDLAAADEHLGGRPQMCSRAPAQVRPEGGHLRGSRLAGLAAAPAPGRGDAIILVLTDRVCQVASAGQCRGERRRRRPGEPLGLPSPPASWKQGTKPARKSKGNM
jgi:hypothetical protein